MVYHLFLILTSCNIFGEVLSFDKTHGIEANIIQEYDKVLSNAAIPDTQKLRIFMDYTDDFNLLTDAQFFKDNVITPAVTQLQNSLAPKSRSTSPIIVDRDCLTDFVAVDGNPSLKACINDCKKTTTCSNLIVPDKYLKKCFKQVSSVNQYSGVDGAGADGADIVILTTVKVCNSGMLASALSCFSEPILDRPIFGVMTLCKEKWNPRFNLKMNINTIKHELIHALGFASEKFAFFRDAAGQPLTSRDSNFQPNLGYSTVGGYFLFSDKVAKNVARTRRSLKVSSYTKVVTTLTLPTVLAEARSHFGCATLDGVDLEDSVTGTINSHFDKLFVNNELMSPNADAGEGVTSRLTLSMLQDTGWYTADFTQAESYTYGKGLGCDFLLNGCFDYIQKQQTNKLSIDPFCNALQVGYAMKCSSDRRYIYACSIFKNVGLDPKFVYFDQIPSLPAGDNANTYAGDDAYREYCPVNQKITYDPFTSDCNIETNAQRNDSNYLQWKDYFGSDSKCFDTTENAWTNSASSATYTPTFYGAKCFKYKCDAATSTLFVYQDGQIVCQKANEKKVNQIKVNNLSAYINCPSYADVCLTASSSSSKNRQRCDYSWIFAGLLVYMWIFGNK